MGKRIVLQKILKCLGCLIFLFISQYNFSQTDVRGEVRDINKNPISSISVIAKKNNTDTIVDYTYTDNSGRFFLRIIKPAIYELSFDGLGYAKRNLQIEVTDGSELNLQEIIIEEEETLLDEIIIQADRPITIKKDTIIFKAAAFSKGNERVVEDLLKNIPGLVVDENGRITIEGKEVEKVMVGYDDFFNRGYTILTKNMPSYAIDKVEVLKHYSNNRLLKGIEDSEKVALNLTLKEDKKNIWFGDISLGYDVTGNNGYDANTNIMSFGDKNKYYFLSSLNNVGEDVSGDISYVVSPNRYNEPGTLGNNQSVSSLMNLEGYGIGLKQERINFNNVKFISLNSIYNLTPKTKLKILGLLYSDTNNYFRNGYETFFLNDQSFTNYEDYYLSKKSLTGFGQVDLTYNISQKSMLEYTGKYNRSSQKSNTDLQFNEVLTSEILSKKNELLDHKVIYTNKYEANQVLVITGRFIDDNLPENYRVNQIFFKDLIPSSEDFGYVSQLSNNRMRFAGIEGHLLDKKDNGNLMEIKLGYNSRRDDLYSQLFLEEEEISPNGMEHFRNNTFYNTHNFNLNFKYIKKVDKFSIIPEVGVHQLYNAITFEENEQETQSPFFLNPKIRLEWDLNEKSTFFSSYSFNSTNAKIIDVNKNYFLTGYKSLSRGTGELNQTDASSFLLGYRLGNWDDLYFLTTSINYNVSHNYFSNNIIFDPNYSLSSKILIQDRKMLIANFNLDRYIPYIKTNIKLKTNFLKSNYENVVNSQLRNVEFENFNYGLELRSGFSGMFNFNAGINWKYNKIQTGVKNTYTDNVSFLNLQIAVNSKLNMEIESERYFFGRLPKNQNEYYFLDFSTKYNIDKANLSLSLKGKNLFNTQSFKTFSISDISISSTEYRLMPRFVMLEALYRF